MTTETSSNADYTDEYLAIIDELDGDIASRRTARAYMESSTAIVHHRIIESSFVPRLFNQRTYDVMKDASETAHRILCKVMQRYLDDPSYRDVFDFDPRLVELILLPRGYDSLLPFARIDVFLDEDTYDVGFCEINGDGSSGMNENREVTNSIKDSATLRAFAHDHHVQGCSLFEPWVDAFLRIYGTYEHKVDAPRIVIADYLENGVVDEFREFARIFEERGVACGICDVRDMRFDGTTLHDGSGERIDAIWRRCVTNDVITNWDGSQDLIEAVRAERVALIGSFAGHIVHDKQIFEVLCKPETQEFLDDDEVAFVGRVIPRTAFLAEDDIDIAAVRADKDRWIIKPTDHYGADEVHAGCEVTQERWDGLIDRFADGRAGYPFIVQRFLTPYRTDTLPPDAGIEDLADDEVRRRPVPYNNLGGLYLFDGAFQGGVFSRLGPNPTIYKENDGMTAATIWVDTQIDGDCGIELP